MENFDFNSMLWRSSVPLIRLNASKLPTGCASGCLIDYLDKRVLLTVAHATKDQGNWAIQLKYEPGKGMKSYQTGAMNFLSKISTPNFEHSEIDFSYVGVPIDLCAYRQEIEPVTSTVKLEVPISIHKPTFEESPDKDGEFGFCGMVMPNLHKTGGRFVLKGHLRTYAGLRFLRTESDYHIFSLPYSHPGHEHFQGCSGAPIIDKNGSVVALVCEGNIDTNEIFGVSLKAYKAPIEILAKGI